MEILVATRDRLLRVEPGDRGVTAAPELAGRPLTCLAADPSVAGRAWCGTAGAGLWRSDDGGRSWRHAGLAGEELTAVAASPVEAGLVWAGTEPRVVDGWRDPTRTIAALLAAGREAGELWAADERGVHRSDDGGRSWRPVAAFAPTPSGLRGLAVTG
jgi:photosystem II stability/assembly factor-like uncharacterized protein